MWTSLIPSEGNSIESIGTFKSFWLHHETCGILVTRPGIEPSPLAMKAQSLNYWTAREFEQFIYC